MSSSKNVLESARDIVQDLLVPELKALKVSVESLRTDMKANTDALRNETRLNTDALREELKLTKDSLREEMKIRHESLVRIIELESERNAQQIRSLGEKFDIAVDVRERLASVEARMPKH